MVPQSIIEQNKGFKYNHSAYVQISEDITIILNRSPYYLNSKSSFAYLCNNIANDPTISISLFRRQNGIPMPDKR